MPVPRLFQGLLNFLGSDALLHRQNIEQLRLWGGGVRKELDALNAATVVPIGGCIDAELTIAEIALYFDATGLGITSGRWKGWAIRNGNNGTTNANGKFARWATAASGGTGGSDDSSHIHAINHTHGYSDFTPGGAYQTVPSPSYAGNSGPASVTDNKPAYLEVVPLKRVS